MRPTGLAALVLAVAVSACGGNESTGPERLTLNGNWRQSGDLRDQANGDSHIHLGTFALVQSGESFSGTGQQSGFCSVSGTDYTGPLADPAPFAVTAGTLTGRTVSFSRDICDYQGSFVEGRSNRITGTATCRYALNGVNYTFTGQWQADRLN